jgi:spore maturation protein CgeB
MKILVGFSYYQYPVDVASTIEIWLNRLRSAGFEVESFPLTINPPGPPYWWKQLDRCWKIGDKGLLNMYENLAKKAEDFDVFLNWNGINIHPEFIQSLPTFNIYSCFDDPEASEFLSKPVAAAYDLCMIGNIAEVETYKKWGVKNVKFWPLGFLSTDFDDSLTEEKILYGNRTNDITLLCERKFIPDRIKRLDQFANAFPKGNYFGAGWPNGFLEENQRIPLYLNTKIGPNFHNSTGPINFRTYTLPACGVMQICDNKSHLGQIFELDKEVVGFDTVTEAIEKTRYYLAHDEERRKIAAAGWKRTLKDYNEIKVFSLIEQYVNEIEPNLKPTKGLRNLGVDKARKQRLVTFPKRIIYMIKNKIKQDYYLSQDY